MSNTEGQKQQDKALLRRASRVKDAILYIALPLLGLGFLSILQVAGFELPSQASGYSGAQIAGMIALGLLATVVFLVGPWIVVFWHIRRERRQRVESGSSTS